MATTLYEVNAFTADGAGGNPAGVVLGADGLSEQEMLAIAARAGFSETAFVSESDIATHHVQFFTPTTEVDLCGHATIATWSLLYQKGLIGEGDYTQQTAAGLLGVNVMLGGLVFMQQTKAAFGEEVTTAAIAPLLGLVEDDFHDELVPQIVSTGLRDLLVPVRDTAVLPLIKPNLPGIADFSRSHDLSGFHVFGLQDGASIASARNFAPADGIDEEAATGTSNGALLCYLKEHDALPDREIYRIEQGEGMGQRSLIYGKFLEGIVWIGGAATVMSESPLE